MSFELSRDGRWSITLKGVQCHHKCLNLNQLAILVYGAKRAFMFFARIQTKNQKTCKLGILQWKIYEPKEHQFVFGNLLVNFPTKTRTSQSKQDIQIFDKSCLIQSFTPHNYEEACPPY
jgi:hypothetical protein